MDLKIFHEEEMTDQLDSSKQGSCILGQLDEIDFKEIEVYKP